MKTSKKVFSVIMALMMLISVFAMFSYAAAPESVVDLYLTPDKVSYAPGEIVTFTVSIKTEPVTTELYNGYIYGSGAFPIGYDSSIIDKLSDNKMDVTAHGVKALDTISSFDVESSGCSFTADCVDNDGDTIDAVNNWDSILKIEVAGDQQTTYSASEKKLDLFSFQMKLNESVKDGDYVIGFNEGSFVNYNGTIDIPGMMGSITYEDDFGFETEKNISLHNATIHVGAPAPAGPAVTKAKSQVKMKAMSANTVADEFSFRVISKISDSDWDTYFKNTGDKDAKDSYITAVGMVAYKGAAAFDAETAKRVVAGESVADYTAATTNYISKVSNTADAEFGAIIKANHSTLNNDVTYMGFVQYVDASGNAQTIFYETAGTAALSTNYDNIVSAYLKAYPFE